QPSCGSRCGAFSNGKRGIPVSNNSTIRQSTKQVTGKYDSQIAKQPDSRTTTRQPDNRTTGIPMGLMSSDNRSEVFVDKQTTPVGRRVGEVVVVGGGGGVDSKLAHLTIRRREGGAGQSRCLGVRAEAVGPGPRLNRRLSCRRGRRRHLSDLSDRAGGPTDPAGPRGTRVFGGRAGPGLSTTRRHETRQEGIDTTAFERDVRPPELASECSRGSSRPDWRSPRLVARRPVRHGLPVHFGRWRREAAGPSRPDAPQLPPATPGSVRNARGVRGVRVD
ncbi:unnamed protein product, partial [Protopolystoma xenopodis]